MKCRRCSAPLGKVWTDRPTHRKYDTRKWKMYYLVGEGSVPLCAPCYTDVMSTNRARPRAVRGPLVGQISFEDMINGTTGDDGYAEDSRLT